MPLYLVRCLDKPGGAAIREAIYPAHREHLKRLGATVKLSGPIVSEEDGSRIGSVFVLDCPDIAAARAIAASDPFAEAGLFATVTVDRFLDITGGKPAFGTPAA
ncbi:MAG: YciI family protein [Acetobacteraceae bacterium]|nr:YciI family protein [Acetobacteraceae bacterium]